MFPSFSTCVVGSHHHVSTDRREGRHNDTNILFGMGDQEEEQQRNRK